MQDQGPKTRGDRLRRKTQLGIGASRGSALFAMAECYSPADEKRTGSGPRALGMGICVKLVLFVRLLVLLSKKILLRVRVESSKIDLAVRCSRSLFAVPSFCPSFCW